MLSGDSSRRRRASTGHRQHIGTCLAPSCSVVLRLTRPWLDFWLDSGFGDSTSHRYLRPDMDPADEVQPRYLRIHAHGIAAASHLSLLASRPPTHMGLIPGSPRLSSSMLHAPCSMLCRPLEGNQIIHRLSQPQLRCNLLVPGPGPGHRVSRYCCVHPACSLTSAGCCFCCFPYIAIS